MKVYKVIFENNAAVSAIPTKKLRHHDIGFHSDKETVQWLALECPNAKTALEIGDMVVKEVWVHKVARRFPQCAKASS